MKKIEISNKKNSPWYHRWLLELNYIKEWKSSDLPWDHDEDYKKEGKVSLCLYAREVAIAVLVIGLPKVWKKVKIPLFITSIIFAVWCQSVVSYYCITGVPSPLQYKIFLWTSGLFGVLLFIIEVVYIVHSTVRFIGAFLLCICDEIAFRFKGVKVKRPDKNAGILRIFWERTKVKWGMIKVCSYIYIVD